METPFEIFLPRGMLAREEIEEYYHLARTTYTGKGKIVDLGSFCGASAYAFAAGVRDSTLVSLTQKIECIHCYDLFETVLPGPRLWLQNNFFKLRDHSGNATIPSYSVPQDVPFSYLGVFAWQLRGLMWAIRVNPGDICLFEWPKLYNIEILMIDLAKTVRLQSHVFKHFLPSLSVGGILIQQDFHIPEHYYIPVVMQYLSRYFDVLKMNCGGSRIYRLKHQINADDLRKVIDYSFTTQEEIDLLMTAAAENNESTNALNNTIKYRRSVGNSID